VRVLHSLSFIDDPTRILRAVRYEQRFGFHIETRTLELLGEALDLLERVTSARIRHEFQRIFQESAPERTLLRLGEVGVLNRLHPELTSDGWLTNCFASLRGILNGEIKTNDWVQRNLASEPLWRLYWALLTFRVSAAALHELEMRLQWDKSTQRLVLGLHTVESALDQLRSPSLRPSRATAIFESANLCALSLFVVAHADDAQIRKIVERYHDEWRHVRSRLNGDDLAAMNIPRGPLYSSLLQQLRTAQLDGRLQSREDEERLIAQFLQDHNLSHGL